MPPAPPGGAPGGAPPMHTHNDFYQSSFITPGAGRDGGAGGGMGGAGGGGMAPQQQMNNPPPAYIPPEEDYANEPPLLEELGINIGSVISKAKCVANPFSTIPATFADDADMTGPVLLGVLLGFAHMVQQKMQFGVIYSQMIVGCLSVYFIFNLMSERGIDLYRSVSVLGYSLLPIVILSILAPLKRFATLRFLLFPLASGCVVWSSATAAKIFVAVLDLQEQFWLVFYPLALLYSSFVIITVF